jgi:hypothetical protein
VRENQSKPIPEMKPKGQSDTVAARFAAKLFTTCGASFPKARWQLMNNFG